MSVVALTGRRSSLGASSPSAAPSGARRAVPPPGDLLVPRELARAGAFLALALFGIHHWMALLEPTASGRAWAALGASALAGLALLGAARLPGRLRVAGAGLGALAALALAFLAAGVQDELLRPDRWDELAGGVARGVEAVPGARVPYRGVDEWTRTVIPIGGAFLVVLAAVLAFWPRGARRLGFPLAALVALVALYAVPAIALDFGAELLRGALLTLLVIAFLRLERLRAREARPALALTAGLAVLALLLAPILDGDDPWWDYETWALSTAAAKSTSFAWDHSYGPLNWPRDGREVLRVRAQQPAYWKAQNLDLFNGRTWQQFPFENRVPPEAELPGNPRAQRAWTQRIEVSVRNLRSRTYLTAGTALGVRSRRNFPMQLGTPTVYSAGRTLKRGDVYAARVYTPRPGTTALRRAPARIGTHQRQYLFAGLPGAAGVRNRRGGTAVFTAFPSWQAQKAGAVPSAYPGATGREVDASELLETGPLRRTWRLSQRLRREVATPYGYVRAVERYLADGFSYSEAPPAAAERIEGFLFDARSGYCQQFSGAMALLLRMAGIPARVASGFTSGSRDEDTGEYVVRDFDAHSWVEVWFPGIGWVTRDPTPAAAPPRAQTAEAALPGGGATQSAPDLGSERQADRVTAAVLADEGTNWTQVALLAALGLLALALLALGVHRRRHRGALDPLAELERALRRTGRAPTPDATLQALEQRFGPASAAAGYLRALREARYGARAAARLPTSAQRRGLRSELGRGAGLGGWLRAWWALPPRRS